MIGIDLFSGAGGMALGAIQAGVDVLLAIEADPYAASTYAYNHPNVKVLKEDIRNVKNIGIQPNGKKKVLFGGPPCQGFSTSNQKTRNSGNPNNWLFMEFIRITKLWEPDWIIFENVKGIVETEKGIFFNQILKQLNECGYKTSWWILNAADFGVPQKRYRLFIIGSKYDINIDAPEAIIKDYITVEKAISDLPDLPNGSSESFMPYKFKNPSKYAQIMRGGLKMASNHFVTKNSPHITERYKYVPQGGNWSNIPKKLMKNYTDRTRCHTGIYYRLKEDSPSVVIGNYRKNMLIHPKQNRGLSVREAARIQSFPDWYEFKGSIGFQQQQVGNAVPPLLAKAVFEKIMEYSN